MQVSFGVWQTMISSPKKNGERFFANDFFPAKNGMTNSCWLLLSNTDDVGHFTNLDQRSSKFNLSIFVEIVFKFIRSIEKIFDCRFSASLNQNNVFDTGFHGFFDNIENDRSVDDREHFFWNCFSRR